MPAALGRLEGEAYAVEMDPTGAARSSAGGLAQVETLAAGPQPQAVPASQEVSSVPFPLSIF